MKVLIFGCTGMLGSTLIKYFSKKKIETYGTYRNLEKKNFLLKNTTLQDKNFIKFDLNKKFKLNSVIKNINPDLIINALGLIKQKNKISKKKMYLLNSIFPQLLGKLALKKKFKLLHISTDCVFLGDKGFYNEYDIADAIDDYGKSKFNGEINNKNSLTIRTSIIGHEINSQDGLLDKFISRKIKIGFKNVYFSGFTTLELSKIILKFFFNKKIYNTNRIIHLASKKISKFDLLSKINKIYKTKIILKENNSFYLDRSLDSTRFNKKYKFKPKTWNKMIKELYDFK